MVDLPARPKDTKGRSSSAGVAVEQAQVVIACVEFDPALEFFTQTLGFRIDRISPADNPSEADLSGYGVALLLRRENQAHPGTLRLTSTAAEAASEIVAPNGTVVEVVPPVTEVIVPPVEQSLAINRIAGAADFAAGRAGMRYRDLIPNRQGGRFIASHIRIDGGGEVPDYAHFHKVRFQMIYCYRGWVRVVYEDQGEPFVLEAGDCVLQPPEIRHRVLESSPGLEVIEIGCPAEHDTFADHDIVLPTGRMAPDRDFGGQRFVHHVAKCATWVPWRLPGFECRHIGIADATDGLAGVRSVRPTHEAHHTEPFTHDAEFMFFFVQEGSMKLEIDGTEHRLETGDSVVVPAGEPHTITTEDPATDLLEVTLPAVVA